MTNPYLPDLLKDSSQPLGANNEYFLVTIVDLDLATQYPLEFKWKFKDGTSAKDWSAVKYVTTKGSTVPADPELKETDVQGLPGFIKITWSGNDASGNLMTNIDRVDIHIAGGVFGDGTKPASSFKTAGTQTIGAEAGVYLVQLKAYRANGASSFFSFVRSVTVTAIEEQIDPPVAPTGFTSERVLGGIEVTWNGGYAGGAAWSGFGAINIYAGTSASLTPNTYIKVGQMTANSTQNLIVVPVDGTYVRYNQPVYIHASAINKANPPAESSIVANVTNQQLGARTAVSDDLADAIITNAKIVNDAITAVKIATGAITEVKIDTGAITAAKIATGAITEVKIDNNAITAAKIATGAIDETKIATGAITTPKIAAGAIEAGKIAAGAITAEKIATNAIETNKIAADAITAGKIAAGAVEAGKIAAGAITTEKLDALAITSEKIATNAITTQKIDALAITSEKINALAITTDKIAAGAITAGKILAGEIGVEKLTADALSATNIKTGTLAATTFIRVGPKNLTTGAGARIEIAGGNIEDGNIDVIGGFYIYNSAGTAILQAPLSGGLIINGSGTFSGNLSAAGGTFTGALNIGTLSGGLYPFSVSTSGVMRATAGTVGGLNLSASSLSNSLNTFSLDSAGKARFGSSTGNAIIINPAGDVGSYYMYHSTDGGATVTNSKFSISTTGILTATGGNFSGTITNGNDFWNADSSFRFGGENGITKAATGGVTIGSNVTISGSLTAAAIGIDSNNYWNNTGNAGKFRVGGTSKYIYWDGSTVDINGKITADSGQIGGWLVDPSGYLRDASTLSTSDTVLNPAAALGGNTTIALRTKRAVLAKEVQLGTITENGGAGNGYLQINGTNNTYAVIITGKTSMGALESGSISSSGSVSGTSFSSGGGISSSSGFPASPALGVTNNAPSTSASTYPHYVVITSAGNLREYYSSSSIKYKENISSIDEDYLYNIVKNLNPVTFNFKQELLAQDDEYGAKQWGLIAEEVYDLDPSGDLVVLKNNEPDTVRYEILPTYIIGAMKSMAKKIEDLQNRLDALEG